MASSLHPQCFPVFFRSLQQKASSLPILFSKHGSSIIWYFHLQRWIKISRRDLASKVSWYESISLYDSLVLFSAFFTCLFIASQFSFKQLLTSQSKASNQEPFNPLREYAVEHWGSHRGLPNRISISIKKQIF